MGRKKFNLDCAGFMGLLIHGDGVTTDDNYVAQTTGSIIIERGVYSPYTDANERNKIIEKMRIETVVTTGDIWSCKKYLGMSKEPLCGTGNSIESAQVECIENVLAVKPPAKAT